MFTKNQIIDFFIIPQNFQSDDGGFFVWQPGSFEHLDDILSGNML
jgi:hypothetical protein